MKTLFLAMMVLGCGCKAMQPQKIVIRVESGLPIHSTHKVPLALSVEIPLEAAEKKVVQAGHEEIDLER